MTVIIELWTKYFIRLDFSSTICALCIRTRYLFSKWTDALLYLLITPLPTTLRSVLVHHQLLCSFTYMTWFHLECYFPALFINIVQQYYNITAISLLNTSIWMCVCDITMCILSIYLFYLQLFTTSILKSIHQVFFTQNVTYISATYSLVCVLVIYFCTFVLLKNIE